jgi:hypothetical protein
MDGRCNSQINLNKWRPMLPFHLRMIFTYLVIWGFWSWGRICWAVIVLHVSIAQNITKLGLAITAALFSSAYAFYRKSKFAVPLLLIVPVLQWIAFAMLLPDQVNPSNFYVDAAYFAQLPRPLKIDLACFVPLAIYTAFLWKRGELS